MPAQSTMEGFAKMMAAGAVVKGGIGGINKTLAKVGLGSKEAKSEAMYERRQKRLKKEKRDEIFDEEVMLAEKHARANGSMLQAIKDGYHGRNRLNDIEEAHAEALKEQHQRQIAEGDAITSQDYAGKKKANADRMAGNKTEQEWFWGNQKRQEALDRKRDSDEMKAYGRVLTEIEREANYKKERNDAIAAQGSPTKTEDEESGGSVSTGGGVGFGGGEILAAILETNQLLSQTFEAMKDAPSTGGIIESTKPGALMSGEEIFDRNHPDVEAEKIVETPDIADVQKVSMESMLDGEPLPILSNQLDELLDIEREELDFDRRREAREIKADRRALEDRRDSKFKKLGMGGFGRGGKKPDKKKGGGLMNMLMKFGAKWLMPIGMLTGGWLGLKSALGLSTKADDAARLAQTLKAAGMNADDAARLAKLKEADDIARGLKHTDDIAETGAKVAKNADAIADVSKTGAKTTKVVTVGEDVLTNANKITKVADGVPANNLDPLLNKVDDGAKGVTKVSSKLDNFGSMLKNLPKTITNLVKGVGVTGGGAGGVSVLSKAVTGTGGPPSLNKSGNLRGMSPGSVANRFQKTPTSGPPSMMRQGIDTTTDAIKNLATNPTLQKVANLPGANVVKGVAGGAAQGVSSTAGMVKTVVGSLAKGASRVAKVLAPLDILAKMDQGQGLFESFGNVVLEVGNLARGGLEWQTEMFQRGAKHMGLDLGEGGFSEKSGMELAFQEADLLGNKEKWQTHKLEQGIDFAMAKWYGTEVPELKKVYTEEQEALADAAENEAGAVDIGLGVGDIEDLEKLSLLDEKTLQALLDVQVWDDEDQKLIENLVEAKKTGVKITYESTYGGLGSGKIKFGDEAKGPTTTLDPANEITPEDGEEVVKGKKKKHSRTRRAREKRKEELRRKAKRGDGSYSQAAELQKQVNEGSGDGTYRENPETGKMEKVPEIALDTKPLLDVVPLNAEEADKLLPSATLADATNKAMLDTGSIFTHDTHLEKTLWSIWGEEKALIDVTPNAPIMGTSQEMMPSELLAQAIGKISAAEKQAAVGNSGGNTNVNSVSNMDQSVINQIAAPATAHGPITPGTNR